jgi:hypothetical protein
LQQHNTNTRHDVGLEEVLGKDHVQKRADGSTNVRKQINICASKNIINAATNSRYMLGYESKQQKYTGICMYVCRHVCM